MDHKIVIDCLKSTINDIARSIGIPCEVVLHDYSDPDHSIVAISGGLTGRAVGGPLTGIALRMLRAGNKCENLIGYPTETRDGKPLRSSTIFLKDENGEVFGSLCINIELTYWEMLKSLSTILCDTKRADDSDDNVIGRVEPGVPEILRSGVERAIQSTGIPVPLMSRAQKVEVVRILNENGLFMIKGAIDYTADALAVSRPTIYNYLTELRGPVRVNDNSPTQS